MLQPVTLRWSKLWWALAWLGTALALVLSLVKIDQPNLPSDYTLHLVGYGLMMGWWGQLFHRQSLPLVAIFVALFGVLMEVFQTWLTSYRAYDVNDMLANVAGIAIAVVLLCTPLHRSLLTVERLLKRG